MTTDRLDLNPPVRLFQAPKTRATLILGPPLSHSPYRAVSIIRATTLLEKTPVDFPLKELPPSNQDSIKVRSAFAVGPARGLGQESDRMGYAHVHPLLFSAVDELEQATGVAVGHDRGERRGDVFHLPFQQLIGHHWLGEVINARAAATPVALRQLP